jgi:hypothetical protein
MGKVLSPQYLIWLIPFVVVVAGPSGTWARPLFALACLTTTIIYPLNFNSLLRHQPGAVELLNFRNVLLLALLALLTYGSGIRPARRARKQDRGA